MLLENNASKRNILISELTSLFNRNGVDNEMNIPDHILANYIYLALENLRQTTVLSDAHFGIRKLNGNIICAPEECKK